MRLFFKIFFGMLALIIVVGVVLLMRWDGMWVKLPPHQPLKQVIFYDQHWSKEDIAGFYHATQGTTLPIRYEWFLALEQPIMRFTKAAPLFNNPEYLKHFGFLVDEYDNVDNLPTQSVAKDVKFEHSQLNNPSKLPAGFAVHTNYVDPITQERFVALGITCGACHTGQLNYKGTGIRIEGGAGMVNFPLFRKALGIAMLMTACRTNHYKLALLCDPFRFDRFAKRVLGENHTLGEKAELRGQFEKVIDRIIHEGVLEAKYKVIEEGAGRLDALVRIGNTVFGNSLYEPNYRHIDAPVSFPHVWGISWYDWVQYNGSVEQPMVRNAGEALGVSAAIDLKNPDNFFQSSLEVENLYQIERLLGGDAPFTGLLAPPWPKEFGEIDQAKAESGQFLYQKNCQSCHLPPVDSHTICSPRYWTEPNQWDKRFLKMTMVNVKTIGTDSQTAESWAKRFVDTQQLGLGLIKGETGLPLTVERSVNIKYDEMKLSKEDRVRYDGYRENRVRSLLCYKARPLEGIWATPPFLHNGSVPNLYQLLSPVAERDKKFYVTSMEFDPKHIGYDTSPIEHGFEFDTSLIGNSNVGHEFRNITAEEQKLWPKDKQGNLQYPHKGVLGPELSEAARWEIIEYLKTLKSRDLSQQTAPCPIPWTEADKATTEQYADHSMRLCL